MDSCWLQKLKKLMKAGVVSGSDDSTPYPKLFVDYMGKIKSRAVNLTPFGLWNRPSDGALAVLFNVNGNESNKFGIANEMNRRPVKNLEKGESALGNLLSYLHFKNDGNVVMTIPAGKSLTINGDVVINGDVDINGVLYQNGLVSTRNADRDLMMGFNRVVTTGSMEAQEFAAGGVNYTTHRHRESRGGTTAPPKN